VSSVLRPLQHSIGYMGDGSWRCNSATIADYYTVFRKKNTHSHFLSYLHEWCV